MMKPKRPAGNEAKQGIVISKPNFRKWKGAYFLSAGVSSLSLAPVFSVFDRLVRHLDGVERISAREAPHLLPVVFVAVHLHRPVVQPLVIDEIGLVPAGRVLQADDRVLRAIIFGIFAGHRIQDDPMIVDQGLQESVPLIGGRGWTLSRMTRAHASVGFARASLRESSIASS